LKDVFFPDGSDGKRKKLSLEDSIPGGAQGPKDPKAWPCKSSTSIASARASKGSDVIFSELAVILPCFHVRFYESAETTSSTKANSKMGRKGAEKGPKRGPMYLGNGDCCTHLGLK